MRQAFARQQSLRVRFQQLGLASTAIWLSVIVIFFTLLVSLSGLIRGFNTLLAASSILLALILGWQVGRIARRPGQILFSWLGLLLAGFLFNLIGISLPTSLLAKIAADWAQAAWEMLTWRTGLPLPDVAPLRQDLGQAAQALAEFWSLFLVWLEDLGGTAVLILPRVNSFVWSLLLWPAAAWASFCLKQERSALTAVMPAGILIGASLAFSRANPAPLLPLLIAVLLLMAWFTLAQQQADWQRRQLDWAEDIPLDTAIWSTLLTLGIVGVSYLLSLISPQKLVDILQEWVRPRSQSVQQVGEALGLPTGSAESTTSGLPQGDLPRSHLLRGGPELSEQPVMLITLPSARRPENVARNQPAPRYYWRAITYDQYTGQGWLTSATRTWEVDANTWLEAELTPHAEVLELTIQPYPAAGDWLYSPGQPLRVNQDLRFQVRGEEEQGTESDASTMLQMIRSGEWFGARFKVAPDSYQLQAERLRVSQELLQQAGEDYPDFIRQRYLSLPPEVPERVRQLAEKLTSAATTPYERAITLERYLRDFPYSLEVPAPPPGREITDFFLFDLQRGYCDYYATSLAVMARLVGLPSRLAIGYATGLYIPEEGQFWVSEAQAHSWVEIYFPGLGWVEFEPTAGLPAIERPVTLETDATAPEQPELPPPFPTPTAWEQWKDSLFWIGSLALALILVITGGLLLENWLYTHLPWSAAAQHFYRRLYLEGRRLGIHPLPGLTPHEFAERLIGLIATRHTQHRWLRLAPEWQRDIRLISQQYAQAIYASRPPEAPPRQTIIVAWRRLRWRLWLLHLYKVTIEKYRTGSASL